MRVAVVTGHFGTDVAFNLRRLSALAAEIQERSVDLAVFPHGVLTGYHDHLDGSELATAPLPEPIPVDSPEVRKVAELSAGRAFVFGITEDAGTQRANTAVLAVDGEVAATHRKVHLPVGEHQGYVAGDTLSVVEVAGRQLGLLVDYDKTFPEAARTLAERGAELLTIPSAWPGSRTNRADSLARDRQRGLFDLYDRARAAENQLWVLSANQTGRHGGLRFLGQSKIVAPDGNVVATAGTRAGIVVHDVDPGSVTAARARFFHLGERRPDVYRHDPRSAGTSGG